MKIYPKAIAKVGLKWQNFAKPGHTDGPSSAMAIMCYNIAARPQPRESPLSRRQCDHMAKLFVQCLAI